MPTFSRKLVDFSDTDSFSQLVLDYLSSDKKVDQFASFRFDETVFPGVISQRQKVPVDRILLKEVIKEQYKKLSGRILFSSPVEKNISLLADDRTFTVSTGHQLNLFTGPVYFVYKIISTIQLSLRLKQMIPGYDFVPVYWMAGEDHDLDEINHISLFGKKIEWKPPANGAAGRIRCTGISEAIAVLKGMLGNNSNADKLLALFSKAYHEKNNLSEAHRIIVHELFSQYGLVILDPDDARLKKLFVPVMKDDVLRNSASRIVDETIQQLEKNYKVQVHPREINLFYLGENSRDRIIKENGIFKILNSTKRFSEKELLLEIDSHPDNFSPNVVLRPLYQEMILPDLAYIGGPAEISYWLEYKKMFEHYGAVFPVLVLRNCVMVVDASTRDKLEKFGLQPEDTFMNEEDLVKKFLKLHSSNEFSMDELLDSANRLFDETIKQVTEIDPTLKATVEAERQKMINGLKDIRERIQKAQKKKHETEVSQLRKLKERLFPENKLQERSENLLAFYSKYGDDFLNELTGQMNPFEKKFIVLVEN